VAQTGSGLIEHYQRLATLPSNTQARFENGRMKIQIAGEGEAELAQVEVIPSREAEGSFTLPRSIPRERLEVILTATNALTKLLAVLGSRFGFLPAVAVSILYAIAYVSAGYYGLLDGIAVLRERRLDVNLLMILAALGAALIGQPAEGAALLFLFSLSNTLQTYAMGRSRKAIEKLLELRPPVATVRRGSRVVTLPVEKLVLADLVLVRPGFLHHLLPDDDLAGRGLTLRAGDLDARQHPVGDRQRGLPRDPV
jgi:Cd2+/Zn2+-exporting ATPase